MVGGRLEGGREWREGEGGVRCGAREVACGGRGWGR